MEQLEEAGLVGPKNGSKAREIMHGACRDALASADDTFGPLIQPENNVDEILSEV